MTKSGLFGLDWGALQAGVTVAIIPCAVLFLLLQRYYLQGLMGGRLKAKVRLVVITRIPEHRLAAAYQLKLEYLDDEPFEKFSGFYHKYADQDQGRWL